MEGFNSYFLQPGFIFVTPEPYLIQTVLGSCVAVCIWSEAPRIGGMNHYLFARSLRGERNARFGDLSIPYMIHLFRKMGAERSGLKAHIVGGGQHLHLNSMIGNENAKIAEEILQKHRIEIATRDTGGPISRKVIFNTVTGEIFISKVNKAWESDWYK